MRKIFPKVTHKGNIVMSPLLGSPMVLIALTTRLVKRSGHYPKFFIDACGFAGLVLNTYCCKHSGEAVFISRRILPSIWSHQTATLRPFRLERAMSLLIIDDGAIMRGFRLCSKSHNAQYSSWCGFQVVTSKSTWAVQLY